MDFFKNFNDEEDFFVERIKKILFSLDDKVFDKLDFYDHRIYQDPFLIAALHEPYRKYLDHTINCYSKNVTSFEIEVDSHSLYLPTYGYFKFDNLISRVIVHKENEQVFFEGLDGNLIDHTIVPIKKNKFGIEYFNVLHPIINGQFITDKSAKMADIDIYESRISKALEIIQEIYPKFFALILKSVKKIVIFHGNDNSFASIQTQGIIYINIREKDSTEVFFLDDILHQSAHVIFNILTFKSKTSLFLLQHNSQFSEFTGDKKDQGELYARFHGLFTQTNINNCLIMCLKKNTFQGLNHLELIGRIVDNMQMFQGMINRFNKQHRFKKEGLKWYLFFRNEYEQFYQDIIELIHEYDVSNQPYVFSAKLFLETNRSKIQNFKLYVFKRI